MKNQKLIMAGFITLVILNLILIVIIFFGQSCGKGPHRHHGYDKHDFHQGKHIGGPEGRGPHQLAIFSDELDLNEDQEKKFSTEIDSFHIQMRKIMDEKKELKKQLLQPGNRADQNVLLDKIAAAERTGAALELNHFTALKSVLTDEQKTKFDTLVSRMNSFRGPRGEHFRRGHH